MAIIWDDKYADTALQNDYNDIISLINDAVSALQNKICDDTGLAYDTTTVETFPDILDEGVNSILSNIELISDKIVNINNRIVKIDADTLHNLIFAFNGYASYAVAGNFYSPDITTNLNDLIACAEDDDSTCSDCDTYVDTLLTLFNNFKDTHLNVAPDISSIGSADDTFCQSVAKNAALVYGTDQEILSSSDVVDTMKIIDPSVGNAMEQLSDTDLEGTALLDDLNQQSADNMGLCDTYINVTNTINNLIQ